MAQTPDKYTPFDGSIEITLLDDAGEPIALSSLADVEVRIQLQGSEKLKFKKTAATGWLAWEDAAAQDGNVIKLPLTVTQTALWRGLVQTLTVTVKDGKRSEPIVKSEFIAVKSGISYT